MRHRHISSVGRDCPDSPSALHTAVHLRPSAASGGLLVRWVAPVSAVRVFPTCVMHRAAAYGKWTCGRRVADSYNAAVAWVKKLTQKSFSDTFLAPLPEVMA
mmetsp:Transcript_1687/g.3598  ORF Transcript_1687/g.3598 Transcript_1687/m.3598 type:complete len:102 (+) Transcript_1687:107-412(+)